MPAPHHSVFTSRMPFYRPTNSVKALEAYQIVREVKTEVTEQTTTRPVLYNFCYGHGQHN